jgi:hypothetical protein
LPHAVARFSGSRAAGQRSKTTNSGTGLPRGERRRATELVDINNAEQRSFLMKTNMKVRIGLGVASAALLAVGAAWAATDSTYFTVLNLVLEESNAKGYTVVPQEALTGTDNNPHSCQNGPGRFLPLSTTDATSRDLQNRTLLSAFLAGKKVSLRLSSDACSGTGTQGYPVYFGVKLRNDR